MLNNNLFEIFIAVIFSCGIISIYLIKYICKINRYKTDFSHSWQNFSDFITIIKEENSRCKKILYSAIISIFIISWIVMFFVVIYIFINNYNITS